MENKTMECVEKVFKEIKKKLGLERFKKLFEVILTDNGSEFFNPISIEKDEKTEEIVTHIFYCDPGASWQKGAIEKNHEYIRYVLPKGSSFDELTQEKMNILMSNINSTSRDTLNGKTPYEATLLIMNEEELETLGITKILADEVNLSPKLLKAGDK
jgi:IS30 family transposase